MTKFNHQKSNTSINPRISLVNKRLVVFFAFILFVNFNHNWLVAGENTSRNFQYKSWQDLTKNSSLFRDVSDSDIFISSNQNDAFETNAGSFYANTGIRLAYLFNTRLIFPDIDKCTLGSGCELTGLRQKVVSTLPNLTRGTYVPKKTDKKRIDDWVGINSRKDALIHSRIWAFDIYLLTPTTYFSYLAPFLEDENRALVNFSSLRVITITSNKKNEFVPAVANICLVEAGKSIINNGLLMTEWKVPNFAYNPGNLHVNVPRNLDYRGLQAGACAIK